MSEELISLQAEEDALDAEYSDIEKRKSDKYLQQKEVLDKKRADLLDKINKFKSGEYSYHYLKKLLWAIDTKLSSPFISLNFD
jgi:hypothetical protein